MLNDPPTDGSSPLARIGRNVTRRFEEDRRLITFQQLLELFEADAYAVTRNAVQYLRDTVSHFGSYTVPGIGREDRRYRLFDGVEDDPDSAVVGQEDAQRALVETIQGAAQDGHLARMLVLHGPNGSGKSSLIESLQRGLERYSHEQEGALYALRWIFPKVASEGTGLGFGAPRQGTDHESYALLQPEDVAGRVVCEFRDNPLFVIPDSERRALLDGVLKTQPHRHNESFRTFLTGNLCPKCKQIYEGLLAAYQGDWHRVVRHVQVERVFVSRRYRMGAVVTQPQGTADAQVRVLAADALVQNLPPVLQARTLYEVSGDLPDANRGLLEFSDFLKRNLEYSKYLLQTTENGFVSVGGQLFELDLVFSATVNEVQLSAFRQTAEFASFRGRMAFVRVPYLRRFDQEGEIYARDCEEIARSRHVSPHVPRAAALFAVLTRLLEPDPERYPERLRELIDSLTPLEKAWLYSAGRTPSRLGQDDAQELMAVLPQIRDEHDDRTIYEGWTGASVRDVQSVLLRAAEQDEGRCLTPRALMEGFADLVRHTVTHPFLESEPKEGFLSPAEALSATRTELVRWIRQDIENAMELVDESEYDRRFDAYFQHLVAHTTGDTVRDPATGRNQEPSRELMESVESVFSIPDDIDTYRKRLVARIGAYALDNPEERPPNFRRLFPDLLRALRAQFFEQRREQVNDLERHLLLTGTPDFGGLSQEQQERAETTLENLLGTRGYCKACVKHAIGFAIDPGGVTG